MRWLQFSVVRIAAAAVPIVAFTLGVTLLAPTLGVAGPVVNLISAAGTIGLYIIYVRLVERRPVDELAGAGGVAELARGAVLGALLFAATIAVLCALGTCTIERGGHWRGAAVSLAGAVAAAINEEILLRAILFRLVERSLGTWIALALSAALFGVLHAFNPGASLTSTIAIALEAGVLLAAAFALTRRLWVVFGMHAAWNFTEGGVFGASVSGQRAHGLLATTFHGDPLVTGGGFGPEASIVAIVVCLTAGVVLLYLAHRRGRFVPWRWHR
jgi:membrane protease YdiL (CAAX protease family)